MVAAAKATVESQREAAQRGRKGTVAIDGSVAARGDIGNHDNVASKGRRGQQRGDVGEGDLGGRGGKDSGDKQGQRLLQRVMVRLEAVATASGKAAVRAGNNGCSGLRRPQGEMGKTTAGPAIGYEKQRRQRGSNGNGVETATAIGEMGKSVAWGRRLAAATGSREERKKGQR
ncbi:hypothetical protein BHM03_00040686 [Ensete ventricosum]|nr:hypothetical protein BHM03_00040686 [Ensete ventricosum]